LTAPEALSLAAAVALGLVACGPGAVRRQGVESARHWPLPAADVGDGCADVSDRRVCWDGRGEATSVARETPPFPAPSPLGFLCTGQGQARTCEPRDAAGAFVCEGSACTQKHPRQPDEGEWQCADDSGVTVCAGGEPPSGVPPASPAPGWICGARRGSRVCVDLSPDFPDGSATGFRCRWSYEAGVTRICARDPGAHVVGDACDAGHPCVAGARCAGGRCVPPRPAPACWLDAHCSEGSCRFGSCLAVVQ
jgi:hypothetical protein